MILILCLYISLSVLNISNCDQKFNYADWRLAKESKESNKIYLLKPTDDQTLINSSRYYNLSSLYAAFIEKCSDFYDINFVDDLNINDAIIIANDRNESVIHLFLQNPSIINFNSKNIIHAGEIVARNKMIDVLTANFTPNNVNDEVIRNETQSTWITTEILLSGTKIMNERASEVNSGDLLDFVTKMEYTSYGKIKTRQSCFNTSIIRKNQPIIIVCEDIQIPSDVEFNIIFKPTNICAKSILQFQNNLIAVIAPKPFEFDMELLVPTIFYETTYLNSEYTSMYPNSMNLLPGLLLKHAFMKLIDDHGWQRVAIVSDDSPYSIELENELVQLFNKKGLVYNVQRCDKKECNILEALDNLRRMKAKIVIANVEEKHTKLVDSHNERYGPYKFNFLFRVPPFSVSGKHYFITLSPVNEYRDICSVNPACTAIYQALNIVQSAYVYTKKQGRNWNETRKIDYHRNFVKSIDRQQRLMQHKAIANINTGDKQLILSMYIGVDGVNNQRTNTYVTPPDIPSDTFEACLIKSNNFAKYCDISIILYFMLVVAMFAITAMMISCYFHKSSPVNAIRYQQF